MNLHAVKQALSAHLCLKQNLLCNALHPMHTQHSCQNLLKCGSSKHKSKSRQRTHTQESYLHTSGSAAKRPHLNLNHHNQNLQYLSPRRAMKKRSAANFKSAMIYICIYIYIHIASQSLKYESPVQNDIFFLSSIFQGAARQKSSDFHCHSWVPNAGLHLLHTCHNSSFFFSGAASQ